MKNWPQFILGLMVFVSGIILLPLGGPVPVGVVVAALGVLLLVRWSSVTHQWQCGECGTIFKTSMVQDLTGINDGIRRKLLHCPTCGGRHWCRGI